MTIILNPRSIVDMIQDATPQVLFTVDELEARVQKYIVEDGMKIQSNSMFEGLKNLIQTRMRTIPILRHQKDEDLMQIANKSIANLESIPLTLMMLRNATTITDVVACYVAQYKMCTGDSFLFTTLNIADWVLSALNRFSSVPATAFDSDHNLWTVQSGESKDFTWILTATKEVLGKWTDIRNSKLVEKLHDLFQYMLSFGMFSCLGLDFQSFNYDRYSALAVRKKFNSWEGFIHTLITTCVWMLERGMQCLKTGSFEPMFHSAIAYTKWVKTTQRLREDAYKMVNPEVFGLDYHVFTHDLTEAIVQGEAMEKYADSPDEKKAIGTVCHELRLLDAQYVIKDAASKKRRAPFAVLIEGDSCVGKSNFSQILFHHYGKIMHKPTEEEFMYPRCSADKFWSKFRTDKWCIRLDDVAMQSTKLGTMDPSMADMLQVINEVPFCPPMASIEEKGNIALRPDFVMATTNEVSLNADTYYACPLAVRRRFPYVFSLQVKEQYRLDYKQNINGVITHSQSMMMDGKKIDPIKPGDYQDTWNIRVQKVVGQPKAGNPDRADVQLVDLFVDKDTGETVWFTSIYDFLAWFSGMVREHHKTQLNNVRCGQIMEKIEVCETCFRPVNHCSCEPEIQSGFVIEDADEIDPEYENWLHHVELTRERLFELELMARNRLEVDQEREVEELLENEQSRWTLSDDEFEQASEDKRSNITKIFDFVDDTATLAASFARCAAANIALSVSKRFDCAMEAVSDLMVLYQVRKLTRTLSEMGQRLYDKLADWRVITLITVILAAWPIYKGLSVFTQLFRSREDKKTCEKMDVNGGVVPSTFAKDEKPNCWVQDEFRLTDMHLADRSIGWAQMPMNEVYDRVKRSVVNIRCEYLKDGSPFYIPSNATCLEGHIYMMNNHCVPPTSVGEFTIHFVDMERCPNLNSNIKFVVKQSRIFRMPEQDLAFFYSPCAPKPGLHELMMKEDVPQLTLKGSYVFRDEFGFAHLNEVRTSRAISYHAPKPIDRDISGWLSDTRVPTAFGQCGMPFIGQTVKGPIFAGIHQMGAASMASSIRVNRKVVSRAFDFFGPQVQSGCPNLFGTELGPLNQKSVFRWSEEGQAYVFGSTIRSGFRAAPKSRVQPTAMSEAAQAAGFVKRCGQPAMKGPEPWRNGIVDTLTQTFLIDHDILKECADAYVDDILKDLPEEDLKEIIVLDDVTTLNGYPGVKFLDKMNRNTSMGFPYRKSKRHYMTPRPADETYQQAVDFTPEVMEEVKRIIALYEKGERAMPVFTASLKDEPLPQKKIDIKKTRVFLGASAPWAFVVRKYLLAFVRVFQKNPLLFEGAPGVNPKSKQWQQFYDYLVKHGLDRLIAGDFAKYDKRMEPIMILFAFYCIEKIARAAGWCEVDLRVIRCIAEDVAYAMVDFQGDFIELLGSNPSGQPLTVIINCIANSLYNRYCYHEQNPARECKTFKKNVNLLTYGDDNGMGVSKKAPWFNHTANQATLAKIGVVYTMADKEAASVPYIHIDDVSFLKRAWRWDEELQAMKCPLEWASLDKTMTMCCKSQSDLPEVQAIKSIESVMSEIFEYGREKFDEYMPIMKKIVHDSGLDTFVTPSTFVSYDVHCDRFRNANNVIASTWIDSEETDTTIFDLHAPVCTWA
jgi:hypothetical protein